MQSIIFLYSLLCVAALSGSTLTTEEPWTARPSNADPKWALRCSNGKYINYFGGTKQIECQSELVSEWETFIIGHVAGHNHVSLRGDRSGYAQVQSNGQNHYTTDVWANAATDGPRSTFEKFEHAAEQKVSFKCINNLFLNVHDDGKLWCDAGSIGDTAKFQLEKVPT